MLIPKNSGLKMLHFNNLKDKFVNNIFLFSPSQRNGKWLLTFLFPSSRKSMNQGTMATWQHSFKNWNGQRTENRFGSQFLPIPWYFYLERERERERERDM